MKKISLWGIALLAVMSVVSFASCSSDGDGNAPTPQGPTLSRVISVDNASYVEGSMPVSSGALAGLTASSNRSALAGGANIVNITSPTELERFYVGIEGIEGYYEIASSALSTRAEGEFVYTLTLNYSTELNTDVTVIVSALTVGGEVVDVLNSKVTYVVSVAGDLTINLTFDQLKDVDLHLFLPDSTWIYYGNRGYYDTDTTSMSSYQEAVMALEREFYERYGEDASDEAYAEFEQRMAELERNYSNITSFSGLDHDSNPACNLDSLNNENIVIKAGRLIPGTYRVYVNMYSNCSPWENPTKWNCNIRFNGNPVTAIEGENPAAGEFAADASSNSGDYVENMQLVAKFELTAEQIASVTRSTRGASAGAFIPAALTESAIDKAIEGGHWYMPRYRK